MASQMLNFAETLHTNTLRVCQTADSKGLFGCSNGVVDADGARHPRSANREE